MPRTFNQFTVARIQWIIILTRWGSDVSIPFLQKRNDGKCLRRSQRRKDSRLTRQYVSVWLLSSVLPSDQVEKSGLPSDSRGCFINATLISHLCRVKHEQKHALKRVLHRQHLQRHPHRERAEQTCAQHYHVSGRCGGEPPGPLHPRGPSEGASLQVVGLLHPGDRPGAHRPTGHLYSQPDRVHLLRSQPLPDQPGRGETVPALRLRHEFFRTGANAHPVRHGRGAVPGHQPPLFLLRAHPPQLRQNHPILDLSLFSGLLPPAVRRIRSVPAVLPRDVVLHWHGRDGGWARQLSARFLPVLLVAHGSADPGRVRVQRLGDHQPVPDAPEPGGAPRFRRVDGEAEEDEPGLFPTGRRGDGPPGAAGAHHCHLRCLFPAAHCKYPCVCAPSCLTARSFGIYLDHNPADTWTLAHCWIHARCPWWNRSFWFWVCKSNQRWNNNVFPTLFPNIAILPTFNQRMKQTVLDFKASFGCWNVNYVTYIF